MVDAFCGEAALSTFYRVCPRTIFMVLVFELEFPKCSRMYVDWTWQVTDGMTCSHSDTPTLYQFQPLQTQFGHCNFSASEMRARRTRTESVQSLVLDLWVHNLGRNLKPWLRLVIGGMMLWAVMSCTPVSYSDKTDCLFSLP